MIATARVAATIHPVPVCAPAGVPGSPAEVWRPIPGRPTHEASSLGRIRRLRDGRILSPCRSSSGYLQVTIGRASALVHAVVAGAFFGPPPAGRPPEGGRWEVDHLDGDKLNNKVSNLEWVSSAENRRRASARGLLARGERHPASRLDAEAVRDIRRRLAAEPRPNLSEIGRRHGVSCTAVRAVRDGLSWAWLD